LRQAAIEDAEQKLVSQAPRELQTRIEKVLNDGLQGRELNASENAAWQIMHGVVCYGTELMLQTPDRGQIGALEYAFSNGQIIGFEISAGDIDLPSTGRHGVKARLEPGSYIGQGHVDQWLAVLAMGQVPIDTPLRIGEQEFTVRDWARQAQFDVTNNLLDEFSWKPMDRKSIGSCW
jgi:hypothetical protein